MPTNALATPDHGTFWTGFLIGLSIAAPVGPIGVLCIRRTLTDGRLTGFVTGLGAAAADAFYGACAAFGLAAITNFLVGQQFWFRLLGGLFLCYLGVKTFRAEPATKPATATSGGLLVAFTSTLALTLTNPTTILSFVVVFAGLGLGDGNRNHADAITMVAGVFLGSAAWWLILSGGVGLARERFTPVWMRRVNQISGLVIAGFGLLALVTMWKKTI